MTETTSHNADTIATLVSEVGEHLSNIYLGKDNPRRQEFVGRLEEMVRAQLKKEQFALIHGVPVESVMYASEALNDSQGTDKPMSPMRVKDSVAEGYFRDSKAMQKNPDIVLNVDLESGEVPDQIAITHPEGHDGVVSIADEDGVGIVAADTSYFMRSYGSLQELVSEWAENEFGRTGLPNKFERMVEEMDVIIKSPNDLAEWADLLMILMHAMKGQNISIDEVLHVGYEKLEILKRRVYHYDEDNQRWVYTPAPGYTSEDVKLSVFNYGVGNGRSD